MSVQGVKRETAAELQQLEREQQQLLAAYEDGDTSVQTRLRELALLIRAKRAEAKAHEQKLARSSKAHQTEQNRTGIDTQAAQRKAAKQTAGLLQTKVVRGQISEATAKNISSDPRAAAVPGHPPSAEPPNAKQLESLLDRMLIGFDVDRDALADLATRRHAGSWTGPKVSDLMRLTRVSVEGTKIPESVLAKAKDAANTKPTAQKTALSFRVGGTPQPRSKASETNSAQTHADGYDMPQEFFAAYRSYGTWTDGMLMHWILRFMAEEQSARSQRKELRDALDELALTEALNGIADRIRSQRHETAKAISNFFQGLANFSDNYYRSRVKQLIERNPRQAQRDRSELREVNRGLANRISPLPDHVPGPDVLTPREQQEILSRDPSVGPELERSNRLMKQWRANSGVAGEAALYENAMVTRIQQQVIGVDKIPKDISQLGQTLNRALAANPNRLKIGRVLKNVSEGEPVSDADIEGLGFGEKVTADLKWLNKERARSLSEARSIFRELGGSSFAGAVRAQQRKQLNEAMTGQLGKKTPDENKNSTRSSREDYEYNRELRDRATRLKYYDEGAAYSPLEDGKRTGNDYRETGTDHPRVGRDEEVTQGEALQRFVADTAQRVGELNNGNTRLYDRIDQHLKGAKGATNAATIRRFTDTIRDPLERQMVHTVLTLRSSDRPEFVNGLLGNMKLDPVKDPTAALNEGERKFIKHAANAMLLRVHSRAQASLRSKVKLDANQQAGVDSSRKNIESLDPAARSVVDGIGSSMAGSATSDINAPYLHDLESEQQFQQAMKALAEAGDALANSAEASKLRIFRAGLANTKLLQRDASNTVRSMTASLTGLLAQLMQAMRIARS